MLAWWRGGGWFDFFLKYFGPNVGTLGLSIEVMVSSQNGL